MSSLREMTDRLFHRPMNPQGQTQRQIMDRREVRMLFQPKPLLERLMANSTVTVISAGT